MCVGGIVLRHPACQRVYAVARVNRQASAISPKNHEESEFEKQQRHQHPGSYFRLRQDQGRIDPILTMAPEEAKSQPLVMVRPGGGGVGGWGKRSLARVLRGSESRGF